MNSRLPYFPNLDASRFIAFLLVFSAHAFVGLEELPESSLKQALSRISTTGFLGLEYFFVLSSFLISWLILHEKKVTGKFVATQFIARRTLRVWPLYFFMIAIGYLVVPLIVNVLNMETTEPLPNVWYHLTFVVNFYIIENDHNYLLFLTFLWSISVEEQFYLIWAGFMKWIEKGFPVVCGALIIISLVFRSAFLDDSAMLYYHTVSTLGNFGIGGLTAWLLFSNNELLIRLKSIPRAVSFIPYILFLVSYTAYQELFSFHFSIVLERLWFSILFAWIIVDQAFNKKRLISFGKWRWTNYLGKISYGLYCFHGVVISLLILFIRKWSMGEQLWMTTVVYPLIVLPATVICAHISYRYFESYFLRLKQRFYPYDKAEHS